jgi:peptidase E
LFGSERETWEQKLDDHFEFFSNNLGAFELNLAIPERFIQQIKDSDIIFLQGGHPKLLMSILESTGNWINELEGKILVGSSGGADVVSKYYGVGKTMNIGEGFGLLSIKFIPHWKSEYYAHGVEIDWDKLKENIKSYKDDLELITLGDGEFKVFEK